MFFHEAIFWVVVFLDDVIGVVFILEHDVSTNDAAAFVVIVFKKGSDFVACVVVVAVVVVNAAVVFRNKTVLVVDVAVFLLGVTVTGNFGTKTIFLIFAVVFVIEFIEGAAIDDDMIIE